MSHYDSMDDDPSHEPASSVPLRDVDLRHQSGLKTWEKLLYNRLFHLSIFLGFCAFIGIGFPLVWNRIWRPSVDNTIESDMRYDCAPLRPRIRLDPQWPGIPDSPVGLCPTNACLRDDKARDGEIRCYYPLERKPDVQDGKSLLPRYEIAHTLNHGLQYELRLKQAAPFFRDDNIRLEDGPLVRQHLNVSIHHYTENHFRVLIKRLEERKNDFCNH